MGRERRGRERRVLLGENQLQFSLSSAVCMPTCYPALLFKVLLVPASGFLPTSSRLAKLPSSTPIARKPGFFRMAGETSDRELDAVQQIWGGAKTVAVVGATTKENMPVYGVMKYLLSEGYTCIPVNPRIAAAGGQILGQDAVASLGDIKEKVDVVDIFMRSDRVAPVVDEAIAIKAGCVWTQIGVRGNRTRNLFRSNAEYKCNVSHISLQK